MVRVPMHCPCLAQHFPSSFRSSLAGAVTVDTVAALGARVAVFMGDKTWYGGFVESIEADGNRLIVFDDGDIREVEPSEIQEMIDARPTPLFKAANASDGGLVNNVAGLLMAARLLRVGTLKLLTADNAPCYQDSSDNGILLSALVICTLSEADNAKFAKFNVI